MYDSPVDLKCPFADTDGFEGIFYFTILIHGLVMRGGMAIDGETKLEWQPQDVCFWRWICTRSSPYRHILVDDVDLLVVFDILAAYLTRDFTRRGVNDRSCTSV